MNYNFVLTNSSKSFIILYIWLNFQESTLLPINLSTTALDGNVEHDADHSVAIIPAYWYVRFWWRIYWIGKDSIIIVINNILIGSRGNSCRPCTWKRRTTSIMWYDYACTLAQCACIFPVVIILLGFSAIVFHVL